MSRREEAKAERRRRIVAAARDLITETGDAGLSMRAIAARAGVSLTTPYNLFGSKRGIVVALLEDVRGFNERFLQLRRVGAVERIFQAVRISLDYLADDPAFYRTLWTEALRCDNRDLRQELQSPERYAFWWALLTEAQHDGALLPEVEIDPLLRALDAVFVAAMLAWVLGVLEVHELGAHVGYGYALALRGAASEGECERMGKRMLDYQRQLARRAAPVAAA